MLRGKHLLGKSLLIAVLALASFAPVAAESTMVGLGSRELKLLVQTDVFADRAAGYAQCWGIIKDLAAEMGVGVAEVDDPFAEGARKVIYLDTASEQLAEEGLSIRLRIKLKDGKLDKKVDMNVKYRARGVDAVPSDAVTPVEGIKSSVKYEEDVAGYVGGVVGQNAGTASLGVTIKGVAEAELAGNTLAAYAAYYPSLTRIGIPLDTQLAIVGGVGVLEYTITPGELDFGQGMSTEVDMSVWYNFDTGQIIIAEVSYGSALGPDAPAEAVEKAVVFFNELQGKMSAILVPGGMKTQLMRDSAK